MNEGRCRNLVVDDDPEILLNVVSLSLPLLRCRTKHL
jgi:hypothetical protein